ncbi:hypothetical protein [Alistipes ihumii]|uniref:hypothetical protein n=1 Tax=Alistipes ihumii TaxID=1470347 RepID=UPI0026587CC0|nr:hypothetical protein [Alistipes ihumii]
MIIYNRNGDELIDVPITSSAVRKRVLMGDNYVSLPFSHDTYIDFAPGSYIIYNGLKFEIIDVDKNRPTRNATTGGWDYTLQFDDQERHMTRAIVFWLSQKPREAVFHDTTDLQSFGNLIVENMNAFVPAKNWKMRDLSDELKEGTKLVSFNGDTCWNAVNTIAETFGVEWWTEQSEGYIYLCFGKLEIGTEEDFVEGDVITSIPSRRGDDSNYGTRFYVFGSTRNLTEDYGQADQGGTTNHVSEIRLRLPGGQEYIDARPDMAWNDVVEKFVVFEDIYPKNTDTVTSVEKVKRQTDSGTEYEARVIYAKDTPFLPTDLIPGETLQAVITSGALSGRTFDIQLGAAFDDPDTWNPETNPFDRKFEIVADVETTGEQEIIIPNDNLDIEPGNTFVLTGIKLPGARIGEAEQELLEAGTTWAQKNSKDTSVYDCPTNPVYCQLNDKSYELGQKVRLVNEAQFGSSGRSSRIQGYEKSLDNEYQATYTVGDNTAYSRLGEIEKDIQEAAYAERIGVTNGVGIYLIRAKYDQTQPTDYNAYSAAAADEKFLSRKKNDTAEGIITFAKGILANTLSSEKFVSGNEGKGHSTWIDDDGVSHTEVDQVKARKTVVSKQIEAEEGNVTELTSTNIEATVLTVLDKIIAKDQTLSGKISSAKFLSGLLGYGWMIDTQGNGELHSLSIRSFLEVPELRYNQVQVIGDELWVTAGGVISDVQAADSGRYTITLKLEEGQTNPFAADDILRGIYHVSTGFSTIQMRVDSVAEDGTMTVTPRTPDLVPQKFMNIAKTGNFTNTARQRSILISSKQGRIQFMADVNDWEIAPSMVRMILGDTSGFVHPSFGDTSGYNAFLENILMTGRIFQKSADGTTTKPVAVNKGEWETGTYYYYDEVTHKGSLWLCTAESTSEEPSASSIDWVEEVASGAGSAGPAGPALRSRGVWSASETYINGGEFRDWVLYGEHNYRYVVKEGVAAVPAGTLPTDTAYWTPFNEMEPVATRVLLADDAWIDILSTNGIRIGDNGWELTDGEIRHKTSGLKLTKDGKLVAPNGLSLVVGEENIDDYTQQKIDSVEIGTVNLIDKSEEIVLIAGATQTYAYVQKKLHVCPGDEFALSIENIGISAGNPTEFTVLIIDQNMAKELCRRILTLDNRTAVFEIPVDTEEQDGYILFYAGKAGQTNNNSVTYHKVMLVKGNRPALTWSPSLNDQKAQTQEQIDSIQVGSDNLMDDTQRPNPSNTELWNKTVSASVWGEVGEFVAVKIRGQWGRLWQSIAEGFIGGQQYRFSCWVKRDASMETTETKAQFSVGRNAVTIISATLDGVKLGAGGSTGVFSGKSLAGIVISADTFQRLECIFEASETVPGDSFRLEFYTSNYQTNTPCGVVYGYYLVKGNKATDDWRPSLNDTKKAIAAAQAAADQAKEDAAASAQKLEDWSSDELISPPEKPGLVQQKADIESEYGEIGSQADRYGIKSSTYWTAYNSAYTLAIQALTKYTASTPESIPVEADYDYIAAYYPKRQIMLDQIAAAAQAYTDGLQFGSVNLIDGSEAIKITASASATHAYLRFPLHVRPGDEFALSIGSIEILAGNPTEFSCNILTYQMDRPLAHKQLTLDNRTAVYKILEKEQEQDAWFLMYAGKETQTNGVSVIYHEVMLVKGNRPALTWSPSLNDQRDYADQTASDQANEIREEAKATGIYLSEKKIDVVADRFRITSTAGREIMRADADGNRVSMENLDVQAGATIGPVEVTETGLAVKAEGEDLQTVISNQEFGSLSDALGTGKTSIVALTAPSVSQPGGQFDMGTFSAPDATVRILSVSGRVIMMNGLNSVRIYLTKQVGSQWTDLGIELFSMASNSHYDENLTKSVVISSIGNYKIACTAVCGGVITISNMSGTLQEQVKRMEVRPSTIFGMLNSTQYFLLGREKPSASGSEIFRAKIQNEDGGLEVTSTGVNIDGETYIDGQTTINGNASVVGKFSATGEINATGNIQSDTDIEAVRDILIGRYLKGLAIPSEKIPSSMTSGSNYQIANSATCIDAMNKNAINITLPKNPKTGQIVLIRQYSAGYTLKGGGKQIHRAGSTVSEFWNDAYGSLMWIRFDGSYWALNYMPSL